MQKLEEWRELKAKLLSAKSSGLWQQAQEDYKEEDRQVKKSARSDKRAYVGDLKNKAECAAARDEMGAIYKITRQLSGRNTSQPTFIQDKDGNILMTEHEQNTRWVQHFCEVLSCLEPDDPADPQPANDIPDINISPQKKEAVTNAIKTMKARKAADIDSIYTELLNANLNTLCAHRPLQKTPGRRKHNQKTGTRAWLLNSLKKDNLQNCDNWQGITLLSAAM